jgi:hypothetical protein
LLSPWRWEQEFRRSSREAGLAKMSQPVNKEGKVHHCW